MSFNKVFLLGRLGADPELRYTSSQVPVCRMRIATDDRRKNADGQWENQTEWHSVVCFYRTAENCGQYLAKGRQVFVEGQLKTSKWQDKEGRDRYKTEVIANNIKFIGSRGEGGLAVERTSAPKKEGDVPIGAIDTTTAEVSFDDDDIPF